MPEPKKEGEEAGESDWILDINVMLGCLKHSEVKACSISRVSDKIREAKEKAYRPKVVSIGPFHRGTRSDLQLMEETKWRHMRALRRRAGGGVKMVENCSKAIRKIDSVVRASYGGNIELKPHELARIMLLDGCFFLELLLRLYDYVTGHLRDENAVDPILGNINNKILPVLIDLTLLENQIPFIVLKTLAREISMGNTRYSFPAPEELAKSLFDYNVNSLTGVFHFLHLMHLSSSDPYSSIKTSKEAAQELKRCATKLQAVGIKIQTSHTNSSTGNYSESKIVSALREFVDTFDFEIKLNEGELKIPPLRIKEGTEVKWRNLIALEQSGIGIGYKFTSYALFFKGLICSVHDIEQLKANNVIIVDDTKIRDEDLLTMFRNITSGVEQMDERYSTLCESLNTVMVADRATECRTMWGHYCRRVLASLRYVFKIWIGIFKKRYIPDPWKLTGLVVGAVLLVLTIMQTYYAARQTYYAARGH